MVAQEIRVLHEQYGYEAVVRFELAKALANTIGQSHRNKDMDTFISAGRDLRKLAKQFPEDEEVADVIRTLQAARIGFY